MQVFDGDPDRVAVFVAFNIVRTGFDGGFENRILVARRIVYSIKPSRSNPWLTAPDAPIAAVLGKGGADVGGGAVAVVGQRLNNQRYAAGAVAFVADFFVIFALAACALSIARWILSFGIDCALAALTASRRRGFISGSGMPIFAATVISRLSFENCADRFLSCAPLRC